MEDSKSSLGHMPATERWIFDAEVVEVFPDMLRRSIPQYDVMRRSVYDVGMRFVHPAHYIVDLGCSRGDSLAPFVSHFGENNRYLGIDNSPPMINIATKRFAAEIDQGILQITCGDFAGEYPDANTTLTLCILSLQFVPPEHRLEVLKAAYRNTCAGGAFILVEKLLGASSEIDALMVELYLDMKRSNGYSRDEIERKKNALKGILIPHTANQNESLLRSAGFRGVDCFWRWMNFAGFVAVK
ncbi:MAG: methyltransferase domain-containing protein [Pseudomonadales bacterium]|jgi:tRNA (cmo5U34)-methyltransferase|nr:methyltransferase domain-containing protein [Pseudomonadales bacterium]